MWQVEIPRVIEKKQDIFSDTDSGVDTKETSSILETIENQVSVLCLIVH